jgi:hypothetical protein
MKSFLISISAVLVLFVATDARAQFGRCVTSDNAFHDDYQRLTNPDFNDYGRILVDADNPSCASQAATKLTNKLSSHLAESGAFQQWLDGYFVALIFAAAQRIGANGYMTTTLDNELASVESTFQHAPQPCGGDSLNTCMDDFAGTASGYAWMAAYQSRRTRVSSSTLSTTISNATTYIGKALGYVESTTDANHGVCIRFTPQTSGSRSPLCNSVLTDMQFGYSQTLSVNGLTQMIHYGFGLLTSIATAKRALEVAGSTFSFDLGQQSIMRGLMQEAQLHIDVNGPGQTNNTYRSDCIQEVSGSLTSGSDCGRGYKPNMLRLKPFFDQYMGGIMNSGSYTSDYFDSSATHFHLGTDDNDHFSFGRYATYGMLANTWIVSTPTMMTRY